VGSNKTIIGHDSTATIKGRGLVLRHVENVIVRNLTITDINPAVIWGGDAIDLSDVKNVWIDHDTFSLIGRQMIVAHFGRAQNVTLSWNLFDGKTPYYVPGHYYNILFITTQPTKAVIAHNWFRDFSGRSPALHEQGSFHIYNNLFQNGAGQALEMHDQTQVLLEGNDFANVRRPIVASGEQLFAPLLGDASRASCTTQLHRECEANRVTGASSTDGFKSDPAALAGFAAPDLGVPEKVESVAAAVRAGAGPGR
jgi:pectate lyase